jgi:phage shock protein PspC (stress-responsive transcriptional regulator)
MTSDANTNLFLRNDTIFGTCQAIGDDFGFNANWLRLPLAAAIFASPVGAVVAYLVLSLIVLASRLVFKPKIVATAESASARAPVEANDDQQELMAA